MDPRKLIEDLYGALSRGDLDIILRSVADDVEWVEYGPNSIPFTGVYHGRESVKRCLTLVKTTQTDRRVRITEFVSSGDTVVAAIRYSGRVTATGRAFDTSAVQVFTFRSGKVASFRDYFDTAQLATAYTQKARTAAA